MQYRDVLKISAFRSLWIGQSVSQIGDAFYYVTFMFMVKKITGSNALVGFVGALETLPYLLFSLYGGVIADRFDRRRLMLLSDLACTILLIAFGLYVIAAQGGPALATLLLVPFLLSMTRVFFMPAKSAAIPALVPPDILGTANALSAMTQSFMPMMSLALSAAVLSILYDRSPSMFFALAVLVNAVSFAVSAYFVSLLPPVLPDRESAEHAHPVEDLKEGLRYVRSRHALFLQIVLNAVFSLSVSPFFVVYVAANDQRFGGRPNNLAWCECFFFAGMVISYLVVGRMNIRHVGYGFIWGLGAVGVFVFAMAFSMNFWVFMTWNFLSGIAIPFADIPITTWRGLTIPDAFQGRVNSLQTMIQSGSQPIGMGLGGMVVSAVGLVFAFEIMGVGMLVASLAGLFDREFRTLTLPEEL